MAREGAIRFIWYLAWLFLWMVIFRGILSLAVKIVGRKWPDTMEALNEFERYGWWISLVVGALLASAF